MDAKEKIAKMVNQALEMEHQAKMQYLSHAEKIDGQNAEPIVERLQEIGQDEADHAEDFRALLGDYLEAEPSTEVKESRQADSIEEILKINLEDEKEAVDFYTKIQETISEEKENLPYSFWQLEHEIRHVIMDEQEHIVELKTLLGE